MSMQNAKRAVEALIDASMGESFTYVRYEKASLSGGVGRWFAKNTSCMQRMPRRIRHTLCAGLWVDLDFVNCHPVILQHVCITEGISCPFLSKYILERAVMLAEIMQASKLTRDDAKKLVLKALNGGSVSEVGVEWWQAMQTEFRNIAQHVANLEHNKPAKDSVMKGKRKDNCNARVMNVMLCELENDCLQALFEFLRDESCISDNECVLIFDGMQIRDTPKTRRLLESEGFLQKASQYIETATGIALQVTVKDFDLGYPIPDNLEIEDIVVIEPGDDKTAAEAFLEKYKNRLVQCNGRHFWLQNGVYVDHPKMVRAGVSECLSKMNIKIRTKTGLLTYSRNTKHCVDCISKILECTSTVDETFVDKLWESNLRYLAFKDGVYCFRDGSFAAQADNVLFTNRIARSFPRSDDAVEQELMAKILTPIFPKRDQLDYFLHCLARALAGEIFDKKWYVLIGERNSGKGVICALLERAFGSFVQTINADNLMCTRMGSGDTAKKQSWMSDLEFKRVAFANEVCGDLEKMKMDGNMIKRMASGGDTVEVRTNFKDETRKKLQCTMFLCCNEFPKIDPADAYETLEVFNFSTKFVSEKTFNDAHQNRPKHWQLQDPDIKQWLSSEQVVDAFSSLVLRAYSHPRRGPPECVIGDTINFNGNPSADISEQIREVVTYCSLGHSAVFTEQIKIALEQSGIGALSKFKIEEYVRRLYGHLDPPPVYKRFTIDGKRGWGFSHLKLDKVDMFDARAERMTHFVQHREEARLAVKRRLDNAPEGQPPASSRRFF
jgi:hypothetical protein